MTGRGEMKDGALAAGDAAVPELAELRRFAVELDATALCGEIDDLAARLGEGRFYVACVGQFKRGKSTLLNALVGEAALPTGVVPVTSAVTILRQGIEPLAVARFTDGTSRTIAISDIGAYVSEAGNPGNAKGVAAIEVALPGRLLATGMCLVDTPGVGSVVAANSEATRAFVPHIDAALVVLGADPPITGEELALVTAIAARVDDFIFVLNKADRLDAADRAEATRFTAQVIGGHLGRVPRLFDISAADRLAGRATFDWTPFEEALTGLALESAAVIERVARRARVRFVRRLLMAVDEQAQALCRPLEESERRLEAIRQWVRDAGQSVRDLGQLLAVQHRDLTRAFDTARRTFLSEAGATARNRLDAAMAAGSGHGGRRRRQAMEAAGTIARELVVEWLERIEPDAAQLYRDAMARFVRAADDLSTRLAGTGAPGAGCLQGGFELEEGFRVRRRFYFTDLLRLASPGPLTWTLDAALPAAWRQEAARRDAGRYLTRLLDTNSRRVASDLDERVLESRRQLETELRARLAGELASAEQAIAQARRRQAEGEAAVAKALARLEDIRNALVASGAGVAGGTA